MIPPEQGIFATSTPFHHAKENSLPSLLSPVSAQNYINRRRLQMWRRGNDSGFSSSSPGSKEEGPLLFVERLAFLNSQRAFTHSPVSGEPTPQLLDMKKRFFLDGLRFSLSKSQVPKGRVYVKDVHNILNKCGSSFGVRFTALEVQNIYSVIRSYQTYDPVLTSDHKGDYQSPRAGDNKFRLHPEYEKRLFAPRRSSFGVVSESEDSGVEVSLEDDSLSFRSEDSDCSLSFYTPIVPQQYDILKELNKINCYGATSQLLSYLSPKDLQAVSSVGRQYRSIVLNDTRANQRRCGYLFERMLAQENKYVAKSKETNEDRVQFQDLVNKLPKQPLANQSMKTIYKSFVEVAKTLHRSEVLLKCPNCRFPSRRINGSRYCCTRQFCSYEFCRNCAAPYHDNHKCQKFHQVEDVPKIVVGSTKSKRNLRRL